MAPVESQVGRHLRQHASELAVTISQYIAARPSPNTVAETHPNRSLVHDLVCHLAQALTTVEPVLLVEHVRDVALGLVGRGKELAPLETALEAADRVLRSLLSSVHWAAALPYLEQARQAIEQPVVLPDQMIASLPAPAREYLANILARNRVAARRVVLEALASGHSAEHAFLNILQPAQHHIGRLWRAGRVSVAMEHYCTAMSMSMMSRTVDHHNASRGGGGKVFVGIAVAGELHDLGLRMVSDLLELAGWDVYFLGANTPHDAAVGEIVCCGATVVGISATVLTHVDHAAGLIRAIRLEPRCAPTKILVGGRPFGVAPALWRTIGADGMADDAQQAVIEAERLANSPPLPPQDPRSARA